MEQTMDSLLQPDALLPALYLETIRRENHLDPEEMLMLAMLEDGIACFQKYISSRDVKGKRLFREAEQWILEENGNRLFSIDNICETIGVNSQYIREELLRWRHHRTKVNGNRFASRN